MSHQETRMDRRRAKFSKDSPKFIFAERLDALLGVGRTKPRAPVRPSTPNNFYMDPVTIASAAANAPMHQPEMISFRPLSRLSVDQSSTSSATSTVTDAHTSNATIATPVNVNPVNEVNRKLLIREMIERNRAARRLTHQHSTISTDSDTRGEATILSTTVVMATPNPKPQPKPKPRPRQQLPQFQSDSPVPMAVERRPVQMSTSVPLLDTIGIGMSIAAEASSRLSASASNPELLSPESPNLMDFPDSDSEGDGIPQIRPVNRSNSSDETSTSRAQDFSAIQIQPMPLPGPVLLIDQEIEILAEVLTGSSANLAECNDNAEDSHRNLSASTSASSLSSNMHRSENSGGSRNLETDSGSNSFSAGGATARINPYEEEVFNLSRASSSSSGISSVSSYDSTPGGLKISDKIVWFTENGVAETGEVKWIGTINERFHAGVEFVNPVGNSSGKLKGKQLFTSALTHGRFIPVSELMFHEDYYHPPSFTGNSEPSSCPNGIPHLKTQDSEEQMPFVCVICQDNLLTRNEESQNKEDVKEMLATKCGHLFHSDCLNKWFKLKIKMQQPCPYCQRMMHISDTIRIFPVQGKS